MGIETASLHNKSCTVNGIVPPPRFQLLLNVVKSPQGELVQPRANEKLFACRIDNDEVLAGKGFSEITGTCFGTLKVFHPLNPVGIAVRLQLENIERCRQCGSPTASDLLSKW